MILKAKRNKGYYKNTNAWIDAVYRNNKELINIKLEGVLGNKQKVFKNLVKEYMDEGLSPTKAVNTLSRSTVFTEERERLRENAMNALRADKDAYKAFRTTIGWNTKIDTAKIIYDKDEKVYIYDNKAIISFKNSPFGINIIRI